MKYLFLLFSLSLFGQKTVEDFGFKHLTLKYKKDTVDILIQSKKGEENKVKPLFFWCQGSLPQPVIKYDKNGMYSVFPFDSNDFLDDYHLVIIGKPGIPVISDVINLKENYCILNDSLKVPKNYSDRNYLDYYVERNNFIINNLFKEKRVFKEKLVVAGHSEGSTIAAKMAFLNKKITHLIYSGGNPYGRILSIISESVYRDKNYSTIDYWKKIVENKNDKTYNGGDTYKSTYEFSTPVAPFIEKLKIPVLITFGTKDWNSKYNDLLYVEIIRKNLQFITVKPYIDLEHNYFSVDENLKPTYEIYNWDMIGKDWKIWLNKN